MHFIDSPLTEINQGSCFGSKRGPQKEPASLGPWPLSCHSSFPISASFLVLDCFERQVAIPLFLSNNVMGELVTLAPVESHTNCRAKVSSPSQIIPSALHIWWVFIKFLAQVHMYEPFVLLQIWEHFPKVRHSLMSVQNTERHRNKVRGAWRQTSGSWGCAGWTDY